MKATTLASVVAATIVAATPANAQPNTERGFVAVHFGAQSYEQLVSSSEFPLYGGAASVQTQQRGKSGPAFDIAAQRRIRGRIAIRGAVSRTGITQLMAYTGSLPSPQAMDQPRSISGSFPDARYNETQIHLSAAWVAVMNARSTMDFFGGPTVFQIKKDSIARFAVSELPRFRSDPVISADSETLVGYHAGMNLRFGVTKHAGVGLLLRYSRGTAELSTGSRTVGGLHGGAGLVVRF